MQNTFRSFLTLILISASLFAGKQSSEQTPRQASLPNTQPPRFVFKKANPQARRKTLTQYLSKSPAKELANDPIQSFQDEPKQEPTQKPTIIDEEIESFSSDESNIADINDEILSSDSE